MDNKKSLTYWQSKAESNPTIKASKVSDINDFSDYDRDFILNYADENAKILDLAAGTGITLNKYYDKVKFITAVEKFKQFSDFIVKSSNIEVINSDIMLFESECTYDLILMFGVTHYFNRAESEFLYKKYKKVLNKNGKLIIKHQFGLKEDVTVEGYSEELKCNYFSQYRHIDAEAELLKSIGFKTIEVIDIYPKECNRWENTHFYAIVAAV